MYANVIVDISHEKLDKTFQYHVPEGLCGRIFEGMAVEIPFGRGNRRMLGYVLELTEQPEYEVDKIKDICGIYEKQTDVEGRLIALAAWMRDYYGSTMIQALKAVLPVKQRTKEKQKKQVRLLASREEAEERLAYFERKHQKARARLVRALLEQEHPGEGRKAVLPMEIVSGKLGVAAAVVRALEEQKLVCLESSRIYRDPTEWLQNGGMPENPEGEERRRAGCGKRDGRIVLNEEQQRIADAFSGSRWDETKGKTFLIHGVTGSGKTEVYMELIACALSRGEQAIVLIPEIALTYQTVMRFYRRFGKRVSILHSRLSQGERYDQYEKAKNGLIDIMIGPRSALFTPFSNLGIIIIDEEHEESYKSESAPRYHARETAIRRAAMEDARVVLGSATPSVESYYRAETGEYTLFELKNRVSQRSLPAVTVEDMRRELKEGNRGILSRRLLEWIRECLEKKQQVILFLNRRGYAGFVACRSCGHVIGCPHCNVSLALHAKGTPKEHLECHYCGYTAKNPAVCPKCGSPFIGNFQVGTQQVSEQVQRIFPKARILRMDLDTTREKDGYARILSAFADQEADILIGTQMIVKGHDFPNVTLVGALAADLSLHMSDYTAAERTFQLLTQAAGRAGRGEQEGRVVIQTYEPDNYSIRAAARQDYRGFYGQEILYRKLMGYPPAAGMFTIHGQGGDEAYLQMAMEYIRRYLEALVKRSEARVIGPADEAISKVSDLYRKVIYVRHEDADVLLRIKQKVEEYIEINRGFDKITIQYDRA